MADQPDKWRESMAETDPGKQKAWQAEELPVSPMPAETTDPRHAGLAGDAPPAIRARFPRMPSRRPFTLEALAAMQDAREQKTGAHSKRVAEMALVLAREMGVTPEEVQTIRMGALLHDIGKIAVPDSILLKPGALTPDERETMRTHAQAGYDILHSSPVLRPAAEIVISHHERYDGTGYPRGLKGAAICLGARILAVIDTYDAIRADRPYSKGRSAEEALAEILRHRGSQFDPAVVDALRRCQAGIEEIRREPRAERPP